MSGAVSQRNALANTAKIKFESAAHGFVKSIDLKMPF